MTDEQKSRVIQAIIRNYPLIAVTTDNLPYSPEFGIYKGLVESESACSVEEHDFWLMISKERKKGNLPRLRR